MAVDTFSEEYTIPVHGETKLTVLYTNKSTSVQAWITKVEAILADSKHKIVGLDVEYTKPRDSWVNPRKAAVIQLAVGTQVLVYHMCHRDEECDELRQFLYGWTYTFAGFATVDDEVVLSRSSLHCHNLKDIQRIWRDPDTEKRGLQGLKDVAGALIDPFYLDMKDGFGRKEHSMWAAPPPLPPKHLEYAARDAYATYEVYRRLDMFERGFFSLYSNPVKKRARDW
jgi:hypothetical protein